MKKLQLAVNTKWNEYRKYEILFQQIRKNPELVFSKANFIAKGETSKVYLFEGYALKRMKRKLLNEESYALEFTMFTILNRFKLPVPKLYAYDQKEEVLLVEHIEGDLLHKHLKKLIKEDLEKVWTLFYSLLDCILEFYEKDIIPYDNHGKNIMIKNDGSIVFVDINCFSFVDPNSLYAKDICELDFLMNFSEALKIPYDDLHEKVSNYVLKKGFTY